MRRRYAITAKKKGTHYFRMTALEDETTFTFLIGSNVSTSILSYIEYSINEGETWTRLNNANSTTKTATVTVNTNESVVLRGKGTSMSPSSATGVANFTWFKGNKQYKVSGVIMTLLKGKWADKYTSIGTTSYTFKLLFTNEVNLTDAGDLILPPDLTNWCYNLMFFKCTNLTRGPILPALVLKERCYNSMFNSCSNLTYIKMLATNISAYLCLGSWMPSPRTGLEFHRNPNATWWVVGANGIPTESTLFDDTEEYAEDYTFIDPEVHRIVLLRWGGRMGGNAAAARWKNSVRIGGVDGKVLKRLLANVILIYAEFLSNTLITNLSDLDLFCNLLYIGNTNLATFYSSGTVGFYNCTSLTKITLPNTVKSLVAGYSYGHGCFMNTAIESIYIPDSVIAASDSLFTGCKLLKSVRWSSNLPSRVNTTIYYANTFYLCSNLETIENYPTTTNIIPTGNWSGCSRLDISLFYPLLLQATSIGNGCIYQAKVTNLPIDLIFYNCTTLNATGNPGNLAGVGRRRLFLPKCTSITTYCLAGNSASLIDLGNVTGTHFNPGAGNSSINTVTVILRSTAVPTFSTFRKDNVRRIYVYDSIIDDFKADSKCSTAASITFSISGEEWATEFGSYYEYADYPFGDPISYNELAGGDIVIEYTDYNPVITLNLRFHQDNYRSIVLPFSDIDWEYTRMGRDEFREITGVTATVDGEGNLTGFTVQTATVVGDIIPNKPYITTTGLNGAGSGEYTEIIHSYGPVQPTNPITDEFTSNGYKFSFTGTYNEIDNMEGKYAFDGTSWNLCTSSDTMKATYVYMEVTKIEE